MNLQATSFCSADIERYGMGAGIVPMATRPEDEAVCFLLGRERWMPSWKGSCRWSGFEGSRKDHEEMFATAAREFDEESMGSCHECGREEVQRRMRDGDYWIRVVLRIVNEHRRNAHRYHSTHVMRIDWDASIPQRFQETRAGIEYVDRLVQELRHTRPAVLQDLIDVGDIIVDGGVDDDARSASGVSSSCTVHHGGTRAEYEEVTVTHRRRAAATTVFTDPKEVEDVRAWRLVRERLERALASHAHACVHVRRDPVSQHVTDVHVSKDFLEKDQVRWWTMDELIEVIRHRGTHGNERFRPYFLPVLQTILNEHAREFDPDYDPQWPRRSVGMHANAANGATAAHATEHDTSPPSQPMKVGANPSRQRSLAPWKGRPPPLQPRPPPPVPDEATPCAECDDDEGEEDSSSSSHSSSPPPSPWQRQSSSSTAWHPPRPPGSPTWFGATSSSSSSSSLHRRGGGGRRRKMLLQHRSVRVVQQPPPPPLLPPSSSSNSPRPRRWDRARPRELAWALRDRGVRSRSAP